MCETRIFMHTFNLNSISQMKKKIFSALLMGVFTLASMSMFVSCKDYDDDINNLDAGQQELLSRIEALEGNVDQKLPEIESSLATAVENANKALQGVEDAQGLINEVKTTAEAAGAAATGAQEDADAAKAVADEALEKAEAALEALGVTEDGTSLVEKVNDLAEQLGTLQSIANNIPTLIEEAQKATNEELAKISAEVDKYQSLFDNLFAMLTNVELYGTFNGQGIISWAYGAANDVQLNKNLKLAMVHGNVGSDSKFGDNEALKIDDKTIFATATPEITFVKGTDIKVNEGIIVRVNPVNAKITGDNVAIKVINSLGQDMNDYIKVASVEPYADIITRGGQINSGLYKINFEWVDGVNMDAYKAAVKDPVSGLRDVLFAVAINNTDTVQADRYVASTYDLALGDEAYTPANVLSFKVDNTPVTNIRNRWDGTKAVTGDESLPAGDAESLVGEATKAEEHAWIKNTKEDEVITYPEMVTKGENKNVDADAVDKRSDKEYFPAVVGSPFTISLATLADEIGAGAYDSKYYRNGAEKIEYYYVTLDENFAGVSAPSELNAWKSYDIDGLYTVTPADQKLPITINSLEANDDKGDKIGFRVFAVNYDGTLVDPDGRAFYVAVGDDAVVETVNVTVKAWEGHYAFVELPEAYRKSLTATTVASSGNVVNSNAAGTGFDQNKAKTINDATIYWGMYAKTDGAPVHNWADAKYLKVALSDLNEFLDNGTFSFTISATAKVNGATRVVNKLNVNVTKAMPTEDDVDVTLKSSQLDANGNFVIRLDAQGTPDPVWTARSTTGHKDLYNAVTTTENEHYIWTFANAALDDDDKYTEDLEVSGVAPHKYDLVVDDDLIDGKTIHEAKLERNWKNISCQFNEDGKLESVEDFEVLALTANAIFACPIDVTTYAWEKADYQTGVDDEGNAVYEKRDCNWIYYNAEFPAWFTSNDGTTANGPQALTRFIKATNTVDQEDYTINGYWSKNLYWVDTDHKITAKLISNDTQKEDYFKVTVTSYGNFKFTQVSDTDNPEADVPSTLVITAWDAFGHQRDVAKLPFTVKKR